MRYLIKVTRQFQPDRKENIMKKKLRQSGILISFIILLLISMPVMAKETEGAQEYSTEAAASASLPDSIYLQQETGSTCTLASVAMMLRARLYLSNNDQWSLVTESSIKPTAWLFGSGLYWNFTVSGTDYTVSVSHASTSGISISSLKSLLDEHPEGIVLYCGNKPHAVYIIDYEDDTFYCEDPLGSYAGCRRTLESSSLGAYYSSQAGVLSNVTAYWYVSSYSITSTDTSR